MNKPQKGIILVVALIMIAILSLFSMDILQSTQLENQLNSSVKSHQSLFEAGEKVIENVEQALQQGKIFACYYVEHASNYFTDQSRNWWSSHVSCHTIFREYHFAFVIEQLPDNECLLPAVKLYRISLKALPENASLALMLQTVYAKLIKQTNHCQAKHIRIQVGRQSWREVY